MNHTRAATGTMIVLALSMLAIPSQAVMTDCVPVTQSEGPMEAKPGLWNPMPHLAQDEEDPFLPFGPRDGISKDLADGTHVAYWDWYAGGGSQNFYRVTGYYGGECLRMFDSFMSCMASYLDPIVCSDELNLQDWLPDKAVFDTFNCRGPQESIACGVVEGNDCVGQQAAAQGVSNDPSTVWLFKAYTNYGPQWYNHTAPGAAFHAETRFFMGTGDAYVTAVLYADGELVGYWRWVQC